MQNKRLYMGDTMLLNYSPKKHEKEMGSSDSSKKMKHQKSHVKNKANSGTSSKKQSFKGLYEVSKDVGSNLL